MNLNTILKDDFQRLDACIQTQLHSEVSLVQQVAAYIVHAGGKRLRPAMLMLVARALGLHHDERSTRLAAVVEFIHTATLLHDDVVDESSLRRGKPTANALFGNAASVLVGDFLYSRAFQMMVRCDNLGVMDVLADATNVIAEGEVLQLMHIGDAELTEDQYLKVIEYKTAKLFEAAARLPAVLLGDTQAETALAAYGRKLGAAFQIIDDVLDYSGQAQELGKNVGDDLREGKVTLPLIYALQWATAKERERMLLAIESAQSVSDQTHIAHMSEVLEILARTGATRAARERAAQLCAEALHQLEQVQLLYPLEVGAFDALKALAQAAIDRQS